MSVRKGDLVYLIEYGYLVPRGTEGIVLGITGNGTFKYAAVEWLDLPDSVVEDMEKWWPLLHLAPVPLSKV